MKSRLLNVGWVIIHKMLIRANLSTYPFIGIVISAKTDKGVIFFGQKDLFKPLKEEECLQ